MTQKTATFGELVQLVRDTAVPMNIRLTAAALVLQYAAAGATCQGHRG